MYIANTIYIIHDSLKIKVLVVIYNILGDDWNECALSGCDNPNNSSLSYMESNFFSAVGLMA